MPTRKLGLSALLKAVYTRLTTHASTSSYTTYDYAPSTATLPYISMGDPIGTRGAYENRSTEAQSNSLDLHVWGDRDNLGHKQVAGMMDNIIQAISSSALSITGYNAPYQAFLELAEIIRDDTDPTSPIYHGIIRYRFEMSPSS